MLHVEDLNTFYGESHTLRGVTLNIQEAECVGVLGRNGAGKTTTLRSILRLTLPRSGNVQFRGQDISHKGTRQIIQLGIGFVPDDRGPLPSLTVEEQLALALSAHRRRRQKLSVDAVLQMFPRLGHHRKSLAGNLSGGEQQMLAIGRALIGGPSLLILDEPTEGLAPTIVDTLEETLIHVKQTGVAILLVEQNYFVATNLADRVYVMSQGAIVFAGSTKELQENELVKHTYLAV